MKKTRVVHIITKLELGGAQINTLYTYENLDPAKFDAYLISGEEGLLNKTIKKKTNSFTLKSLQRRIHPLKDVLAYFLLRKQLKKINPSIVHTHSSKAGIIGRLAARSVKVPVIIHSVHGFSFSPYQSLLKKWFFKFMEKAVSKITDYFIFVSQSDIKNAQKYKLCRNNYSLIRSGFPLAEFLKEHHNENQINNKYNLKQDNFVCGILAPFKPQKGLFDLIEIADRVIGKNDNVIFFIAGDGKLRKKIETELRKRNILKNFRLPGFITDIDKVIGRFNIGVSTALWEGLPQSLVQFRLKKKPVVATDIPGNNEVVKEGENGFLVKVGDYKGFSERILFLSENKAETDKLKDFSDDYANWDAQYMVKEQERLYFSLLGSLKHPPPPKGN